MDAFLDFLGLYRSDVAKDGSCLFRVVSEQLYYTQVHHVKLRERCVEYMARNRHIFEPLVNQDFDEYLEKIKLEKEWVGEVEMKALSLKYKLDFVVYYDTNKPPLKIKVPSSFKTVTREAESLQLFFLCKNIDSWVMDDNLSIFLSCTGGNRYDCVYSKSALSALAFCQAVVYEVLYKQVFDLGSDVDIAVEKMLHDKAYSKQRRNNLLCHLFKESCRIDGIADNLPEDDQASLKNPRLEIRKALAQGVPPFPYKVAKTLDPGIYRNVEFDMWNEKRKEDQKNEQFIIPKLEPGVKCKVHINKEIYIGHIQDIYNDCDNVSIYIEELCKRCVVSSSILEVVPVPAYKALTWQGGKTYKVYSESVQPANDSEKSKYKKGLKKNYQDYSPVHNGGGNSNKQNTIVRSNSLPSSSVQQPNFIRNNSFHCSSNQNRKKGHCASTPVPNKSKSHTQKDAHGGQQVVHSSPNYPCFWNGVDPNISMAGSPPFRKGATDIYRTHPESPETFNELNDSGWSDESFKNSSSLTSPHYTIASAYSDDAGYSSMSVNSFNSSGMASNATSMPLPIPGSHAVTIPEEIAHSPVQAAPPHMAVYQYPVYAVPSMYLVCRDGSSLPVNIGTWTSQDTSTGEIPPGVPSVIFNTPPTGMSPPVAPWIPGTVPNYNPSWTPGMSSTLAFTPPLEMNAYQSILSPPWSPQSGIYMSSAQAVAYQMPQVPPVPPPVPPRMISQEPAQN